MLINNDDQKVNGWPNYETWFAVLWMDEATDFWQELTDDVLRTTLLNEQLRKLAEAYKEEFERRVPPLEGIWADLMAATFDRIDWRDIAKYSMPEENRQ